MVSLGKKSHLSSGLKHLSFQADDPSVCTAYDAGRKLAKDDFDADCEQDVSLKQNLCTASMVPYSPPSKGSSVLTCKNQSYI